MVYLRTSLNIILSVAIVGIATVYYKK